MVPVLVISLVKEMLRENVGVRVVVKVSVSGVYEMSYVGLMVIDLRSVGPLSENVCEGLKVGLLEREMSCDGDHDMDSVHVGVTVIVEVALMSKDTVDV